MIRGSQLRKAFTKKFDEELTFLKGWIDKPKAVGAIVPTSAVTSRRTELRKQRRSENTPVNSNVVRGGVNDKVIQNAVKMANAGTPIEQIEAGLRKIGIDPAQFRKALGR